MRPCCAGGGQFSAGFATTEVAQQQSEAPPAVELTPSALLHIRRAQQKPAKNRNAFKSSEKKALQIRVSSLLRPPTTQLSRYVTQMRICLERPLQLPCVILVHAGACTRRDHGVHTACPPVQGAVNYAPFVFG